jgi:hypothetical protein
VNTGHLVPAPEGLYFSAIALTTLQTSGALVMKPQFKYSYVQKAAINDTQNALENKILQLTSEIFVLFYVLLVLCRSVYCLFCVVLCIVCFVLFYVLLVLSFCVLFVLCCSMYCLFCVVLCIVCFVLF